jgi:hypothetical protein
MFENLKEKIISYIYNISKQPVKFATLLEANQLFNEGMKLDGTILGFRIRLGRAYLAFVILAHIIVLPLAVITHALFAKLDCHASILVAIFFTAWLFGIFSFFKEWTRDSVTKKIIKNAWVIQFPYFPYEQYNEKINTIYEQSQKDGVAKDNLEQYILNKLSKE